MVGVCLYVDASKGKKRKTKTNHGKLKKSYWRLDIFCWNRVETSVGVVNYLGICSRHTCTER